VPEPVRAAGTALWRPGPDGPQVAVVHRPRYDDWSLPKGKLEPGEHPAAAAVRETFEETGHGAVLGRSLGTSAYDVLAAGRAVPKVVQWWAARSTGGQFLPGDEVDQLLWLEVPAARRLLTAGRDVAVLDALAATPPSAATVLLVRHARAGTRQDWSGPDGARPLDAAGQAQAAELAALLRLWGPVRAVSAPPLRCTTTLAPLGLPVEVDPLLGDDADPGDPLGAAQRLLDRADPERPLVACSQGRTLPAVLAALGAGDRHTVKGAGWVLTLRGGTLLSVDPLP
jgi:8-oxo-dGTP pyrophosphatase MutT (NUDIX family)